MCRDGRKWSSVRLLTNSIRGPLGPAMSVGLELGTARVLRINDLGRRREFGRSAEWKEGRIQGLKYCGGTDQQ